MLSAFDPMTQKQLYKEQHKGEEMMAPSTSLRVFPLCALVPRAQGSTGAVATVRFVWRGHAKTPTTRAGPWPDFALRLE